MIAILQGDARQIPLSDGTVQCCVTSPPYFGLRDYGVDGQIGLEQTPDEYVANLVEVFREVRRVLRDDGTLWLNLGDSYAAQRGGTHMPAETLAGGRSGRTKDGGKVNRGRHDGYNPTRNASAIGLKHKDLIGIPWSVAFALRADGWYLRADIIVHKRNPMPESVRDRVTKAHEYLFLLAKSERYYFDADAIKEPANPANYRANPTTRAVPTGQTPQGTLDAKKGSVRCEVRNKRSVWTITLKPFRGAHFATFPPDLVEPCILAGSRPGDLVLDPFGGSGTTALVARQHGRRSVLMELNPDYIAIAKERLGLNPEKEAV